MQLLQNFEKKSINTSSGTEHLEYCCPWANEMPASCDSLWRAFAPFLRYCAKLSATFFACRSTFALSDYTFSCALDCSSDPGNFSETSAPHTRSFFSPSISLLKFSQTHFFQHRSICEWKLQVVRYRKIPDFQVAVCELEENVTIKQTEKLRTKTGVAQLIY